MVDIGQPSLIERVFYGISELPKWTAKNPKSYTVAEFVLITAETCIQTKLSILSRVAYQNNLFIEKSSIAASLVISKNISTQVSN